MVRKERASCPCDVTLTQGVTSGSTYADSRVLPPSREQLGRASWKLLHATAAQFPDKPNVEERRAALSWLLCFSCLYPCTVCREAFVPIIRSDPPEPTCKEALVLWACRVHNAVNEELSLPLFNCSDRRLFMHSQS